ncbi:hypothetical protein BV925_21820 [Pectobacterium odoriferum]|nr:hypothetical protein BV925_21820 [Pectobacterium odoriferum]
MNTSLLMLITMALLLSGCDRPAEAGSVSGGGGTIKAINHTHWAINQFSVDGQSGIDIIGPYQGGGGGCCYGVPPEWQPGMTVKVDWQTGVGYSMDFPGYEDRAKYLAWEKKLILKVVSLAKLSPYRIITGKRPAVLLSTFYPAIK